METTNGYGGTIVVVLLGLLFLIYVVGPWNWRTIQNMWGGVLIRFNKVVDGMGFGEEEDYLKEGPVHIYWPVERLVKVPLFDLPFDIPLPDLTTAAPNPQNISLTLRPILRFRDPKRVIKSVPDRDPTEEAKRFYQAAARQAVQEKTIDQIAQAGGITTLAARITEIVRQHPMVIKWGLEIPSCDVIDVNWPQAYNDAQATVVRAEGDAKATTIRADAQKRAADTIGQAHPRGLVAMLFTSEQETRQKMAQAGALKTFVQAGSDLWNEVAKWFKE